MRNGKPAVTLIVAPADSIARERERERARASERASERAGNGVMETAPPQSLGRQRPPQALYLLPTRDGQFQWKTFKSDGSLQDDTDKIQINTDRRSNKIEEIQNCHFGEICWYFTDSWEQFRINGTIDIIDGQNSDAFMIQQREKAWFASSLKSRLQYLAPAPPLPVISNGPGEENKLDPFKGPVDAFCLLVFDPEQVDYLNLKSNERLVFKSEPSGHGGKLWMSEKVNP
ncbi:pyridoxine/pyridoxamine 5'-phosphate oxidase 2 isoform X3 [Canna indica]|uniref:pyridoxal 5'-phosphate synthase n=1 Tax=Canna indica TaxID=4628 RepID=A0AAQ3KES8_9LILI|nr:pyridoxine/pyridoxamine 5'-phosphate oxidase 2 isoform X3 [Canna indica]